MYNCISFLEGAGYLVGELFENFLWDVITSETGVLAA
jgi:hypothetical protein